MHRRLSRSVLTLLACTRPASGPDRGQGREPKNAHRIPRESGAGKRGSPTGPRASRSILRRVSRNAGTVALDLMPGRLLALSNGGTARLHQWPAALRSQEAGLHAAHPPHQFRSESRGRQDDVQARTGPRRPTSVLQKMKPFQTRWEPGRPREHPRSQAHRLSDATNQESTRDGKIAGQRSECAVRSNEPSGKPDGLGLGLEPENRGGRSAIR